MRRERRSTSRRTLVAVTVVLAAALALVATQLETRASLEDEALGWTQPRHDALRTGLSPSTVGASLRPLWSRALGSALAGEVAIDSERLVVVTDDGVVHALDAATGETIWRTASTPGWPTGPLPSQVALVGAPDGTAAAVAAGRRASGDAFLASLRTVRTAIESYAIDWNEYPPGPELDVLTPTYIKSLPENPHAAREVQHSDVPSPGDFRYERATPDSYHLGTWGPDEGLIEPLGPCSSSPRDGSLGLADDWPVSAESGGRPTWLAADDGSELRFDGGAPPALSVSPAVLFDGSIAWSRATLPATGTSTLDERRALRDLADHGVLRGDWGGAHGTLSREHPAGGTAWTRGFGSPVRGGAAHDVGSGALVVALGASRPTKTWLSQLRTISTGIESWAIDQNRYPDTGELHDLLVPTYLRGWPSSALDCEPMRWSDVPLPGHYHYVSEPPHHEYIISIWGERGEPAVTMDSGSFTDWEADEPPSIAAVDDASGEVLWRTWIGEPTQDVTPVMLVPDRMSPTSARAVVVGTSGGLVVALAASDGAELWRHDTGRVLSLAPALLPDGGPDGSPGGGIVLVADSGHVIVLDPAGTERWTLWLGATVIAAPATTASGHVLVGDATGTLHVLTADGAIAAAHPLGGPTGEALTTTPVPALGRLHVGRSDGVLLTLGPLGLVPSDDLAGPAPRIPTPTPPPLPPRLPRFP